MNTRPSKVSIILLSGGKGLRFGSSIPKQYLNLDGKPIIHYSYDLFASLKEVTEIVVVCENAYQSYFSPPPSIKLCFAHPGERRQDSVFNGLSQVSLDTEIVCIHDGARPFLTQKIIREVLKEAFQWGAAAAAVPLPFSVKEANHEYFVTRTLNRNHLFEIQTPQAMKPSLLKQGFVEAKNRGLTVTDCTSLIELISKPVKLVMGCPSNLKITSQTDLIVAETLLRSLKKTTHSKKI